MRLISFIELICILMVSIQIYPQSSLQQDRPGQSMSFSLADGTPVRLRTGRELSSAFEKTGENVNFEVVDDVRINGVVVIAHDTLAVGTVINAKRKGRVGKAGKLDISIDFVMAVTGEKIPLRAIRQNKGESQVGTMTTGLVLTGLFFFPAAPLFLFVKGKDIVVPKGTEITAYVNGDTPIDELKVPVSSRAMCTFVMRSEPDSAELTIDGQFIGNTPSTIVLEPRQHALSITKPGFKLWQRTIGGTSCGNITINAVLEKESNFEIRNR